MRNEEKFNELLDGPLENIVTSAVMDTLENNAELANNAGFKEMVIRTTNGQCCQWCSDIAGTYDYPCDREVYGRHDNCSCMVEYVTDKYKKDVWSKRKSFLSTEEIQKYVEMNETTETPNEKLREIIRSIESSGKIEYNSVKKHAGGALSEQEIIKTLAGGDMTDGSCASMAFAYLGQKNGLNVLDFRGGDSRIFFGTRSNEKKILETIGCKGIRITDKLGWKAGQKALEHLEEGKEYYLMTGRHAAIVRKHNGVYQYLELQSKHVNGWKDFQPTTFSKRFKSKKSVERIGKIVKEQEAILYDTDVKDKDMLQTVLGYLNTMERNQLKGAGGNVK